MTSSTLRIRPSSISHQGRSPEDLSYLATLITSYTPEMELSVEYLPIETDSTQIAEISDLIEFLSDSEQSVLLIDADFDQALVIRSGQRLDDILRQLVGESLYRTEFLAIIVLVRKLPLRVDDLAELALDPKNDGRLVIVSQNGATMGGLSNLNTSVLVKHTLAVPAPKVDLLREVLRFRGVFASEGPGRTNYHLFHYVPAPASLDIIKRKLVGLIAQSECDIVLFDCSNAGPWFRQTVDASCTQVQGTGRELYTVDVTGLTQQECHHQVAAATESLGRPADSLLLVIPALHQGTTLGRTVNRIPQDLTTNIDAVSVFASNYAIETFEHHDSALAVPYGGRQFLVDFLIDVPIEVLSRHDWKVTAASMLDEVVTGDYSQHPPFPAPQIALWSLFEKVGISEEDPVPTGRPAKRYFPNLGAIDEWDAHWLAECAINAILESSPASNRAALLIVMPSERNGTMPISLALENKCDVAVLTIPREILSGQSELPDDDRKKLVRHQADFIVAFDESAVTYSTIDSLCRVVKSVVGDDPDMVGAVIDLGPGGKLDFSITSWKALSEVSA